ncbi:MAG TPA: hypothetical protein VGG56_06500 [Terracidiphilus sp.]|jgi:hypothetical protein
MGIGPIASLTPLPIARSIQGDFDPLPIDRVENSGRTGDETYSPSGGKSARGSEDDAPAEDDLEDAEDEAAVAISGSSGEDDQPGSISFFA